MRLLILGLLATLICLSAHAADPSGSAVDRVLCHMATAAAERATGVPNQLLTAISRVESGRHDPGTGKLEAWPWSINVEGAGHVYGTKAEAVAAVASFQAQGARSIDVGCMQINLRQHPNAFGSLSDAFDPQDNALYAARFLTDLFQQTGSWPHAAAAYHSQTPQLGFDYQEQVLRMWAVGDGPMTEQASGTIRAKPQIEAAASPAVRSAGSPFGGAGPSLASGRPVATPVAMISGGGRGLSAYRSMPIAMVMRPVMPSRF